MIIKALERAFSREIVYMFAARSDGGEGTKEHHQTLTLAYETLNVDYFFLHLYDHNRDK